jgi:hypothetical protein
MKSLALSILILATGATGVAAGTVAHGWNDFYARSDYGKLGIIESPNAAEPSITIIPPGATADHKPMSKTWFALNHVDPQATSDDMVPTYVGVLVIIARRDDQAIGKSAFAVHRNSGWMRNYCWRPDCFDPDGTDAAYLTNRELSGCSTPIPNCIASTRAQNREPPFDDLLETQFDGQIVGSPDIDSWNKRDSWVQPQLIVKVGCAKPHVTCEIENILLRFVPSAGRPNMSHLAYYFDSSLATSAAIYTFSPNETDFENAYVINYLQ